MLTLCLSFSLQAVSQSVELRLALDLLQHIHKLNQSADDGVRVPYSSFHLAELPEHIDVKSEYFKWLMDKDFRSVIYPLIRLFFVYLPKLDQSLNAFLAANEEKFLSLSVPV